MRMRRMRACMRAHLSACAPAGGSGDGVLACKAWGDNAGVPVCALARSRHPCAQACVAAMRRALGAAQDRTPVTTRPNPPSLGTCCKRRHAHAQDTLKASNAALEQAHAAGDAHVACLRARLREVLADAKHARSELRRARRTVKTYEFMAEARAAMGVGGGGSGAAEAGAGASATAATTAVVAEVLQVLQLQHHQLTVAGSQPQPAAETGVASAGALHAAAARDSSAPLLAQLGEMGARLALAVGEVDRLRGEREELTYQLRRVQDTLAACSARGEPWSQRGRGAGPRAHARGHRCCPSAQGRVNAAPRIRP